MTPLSGWACTAGVDARRCSGRTLATLKLTQVCLHELQSHTVMAVQTAPALCLNKSTELRRVLLDVNPAGRGKSFPLPHMGMEGLTDSRTCAVLRCRGLGRRMLGAHAAYTIHSRARSGGSGPSIGHIFCPSMQDVWGVRQGLRVRRPAPGLPLVGVTCSWLWICVSLCASIHVCALLLRVMGGSAIISQAGSIPGLGLCDSGAQDNWEQLPTLPEHFTAVAL